MTCWRISNHADLSGAGGRRASARWHTAGHPIIYLASSPASALLEVLVHGLALDTLPERYQWLEVEIDDGIGVRTPPDLPTGWHGDLSICRAAGDAWLREGRSALLKVPSVIVPKTANYLLNPRHPDALAVRISDVIRYPLDPRLLRNA